MMETERVAIVDCSVKEHGNPDFKTDFGNCHIKGAVWLEMEKLKEVDAPLPDTFPLELTTKQHLTERNVGLDCKVVCYD